MAATGSDPVFPDLVDSPFDVVGDGVDSMINGNEALGHHSVTTASPTASIPLSASTAASAAHPAFVPDPNWNLPFQGPSPTEPLPFGDLFAAQFAQAQSWPGPPPQYVGELPQRSRPQPLSADINPSSLSLDTTNLSSVNGHHVRPNFSDKVLNTLTPAQQETLRNIAMPPHLVYQSPKSEPSPPSSTGEHNKDAPSSPDAVDPTKAKNRKRKSSADEEDDDDDDEDGHQPVKKTAHNMIEKRYRTNLNDKIAALRDSVPSLRIMSKSARGEDTTEDREELHGLTPAHKLNKATVLSKATEYIRHLEKRNNRLTGENALMQERLSAFEVLYRNALLRQTIPMSPMQQPPTPMPYPPDAGPFLSTPLPTPGGGGGDARGMIPVTDGMKRILDAQAAAGQPYPIPQQPFQPSSAALMRQQQIQTQQQQQQQQQGQWPNGGPYGRAMLGALAALMIIEVAREHEQSNETPQGRGLFAVPLHLVGSLLPGPQFTVAGYHFATAQIISTAKLLLLLGTLLWVFVPSLFVPGRPKPQKSRQVNATLEAVPSLASPIHVRRQAWLTAVQTVWVPRHNFFLEAAALVLKALKLSLRNAIGVHGYQMLTGLTEEQEAARVKAWTIALDAQLAGGDVEINGSRLSLTLLASWTLPNTPSRLMLKALHIRVMLRQCGKNALFNLISAEWARVHWNAARQLRDMAADDDLPDHLALLLDHSCDEVLNDDIVQRAHNLAWNKPTIHHVAEDVEGMNAVVEDPAVRSPMDAVAAWWSSLVLQRTLMSSLAQDAESPDSTTTTTTTTTKGGSSSSSSSSSGQLTTTTTTTTTQQQKQQQEELELASKVAPIGSSAQIRALVARAVLVNERRGTSIATALSALSHTVNPDKHPQYSRGVPPLIDSPQSSITPDPDVQMALRCAMGIAHLSRFAAPPQEALSVINSIIPGAAGGVSLLACIATFKLMNCLYAHGVAAEACSIALERLAGTLRIWVGSASGDDCGLDQDVRHKIVNRCLAITKSMVGFESDTGYWSMSDGEEGED